MPSFSRATVEMRWSVAACAISMSDGIGVPEWVGKAGFWERVRFAGLDCGQAAMPYNLRQEDAMDYQKSVAALFAAASMAAAPAQAQTPGVTATTIIIGQSAPLTGANAEL